MRQRLLVVGMQPRRRRFAIERNCQPRIDRPLGRLVECRHAVVQTSARRVTVDMCRRGVDRLNARLCVDCVMAKVTANRADVGGIRRTSAITSSQVTDVGGSLRLSADDPAPS